MIDLGVIGAGPCGLAVGVAAKRARLTCSLFDKGPVVASLMRYPLYMTFFSTPEKLEIGAYRSSLPQTSHPGARRWPTTARSRSTSSWTSANTTRCGA